jgi:hypothetical protein
LEGGIEKMNKETILYTLERDLNILQADICTGKRELTNSDSICNIELLEHSIEDTVSVIKSILDKEL